MTDSVARVSFQQKSLLAIATLVILGLICLVVSLQLPPGFWSTLLNHLSTALLVGGLWTGFYELFMRRDFMRINDENRDQLLSQLSLANVEQSLGLTRVIEDSYDYDFTTLLEDAEDFKAVLNDGRTWVSRHSELLRRRLGNPNQATTFFLLHPDSDMIPVLSEKVGTTPEKLREKIGETVSMLRELVADGAHLKVYGHRLYNPHSTFLGDDIALISLYYTSRGRKTVPTFEFNDHAGASFVKKLRDDLKDLEHDAQDIAHFVDAEASIGSQARRAAQQGVEPDVE